jgi:hypothetical protein
MNERDLGHPEDGGKLREGPDPEPENSKGSSDVGLLLGREAREGAGSLSGRWG